MAAVIEVSSCKECPALNQATDQMDRDVYWCNMNSEFLGSSLKKHPPLNCPLRKAERVIRLVRKAE